MTVELSRLPCVVVYSNSGVIMRDLFTDGFNSLAHVSFGFIGASSAFGNIVAALFGYFQVLHGGDSVEDYTEFMIGFAVGLMFLLLVSK